LPDAREIRRNAPLVFATLERRREAVDGVIRGCCVVSDVERCCRRIGLRGIGTPEQ
jgi:hypothetical protein